MATTTIGIPFVSEGVLLEKAVRSVFAQTTGQWNLVLLQDGQDGRSLELVRAIRDPRVSVITDGQRRGLAYRLNQLAQVAEGDILVRMDADDIMAPHRLETLETFISGHDVDVVGSRAYLIDESDDIAGEFKERTLPRTPVGYLKSNAFTHPTVAGRRDWFLANPYSETIDRAEDKELWLRSCRTSRFAKLDDRLLFYRIPRRPALHKLRVTQRGDRTVVRQQGYRVAGRSRCHSYIATSMARESVQVASYAFKRTDWLYSKKFTELTPGELSEARGSLSATQADVPGWLSREGQDATT